ncbi:rpl10a-prov protein [Lynx pardinus]|uniref:Large ribosomal subunit protein uL1 n=1 Tax=Lynx pardinus TaxID=191816 RepID=A0A485N1N7_LYNPA|nr:rpl10a-prov protein [Lynx pardinus]
MSNKVSRDTLYEVVREVLPRNQPAQAPGVLGDGGAAGDQQHCNEAKAMVIPHMDIEALKKLNKNKKLVKKLAKKYNAFFASESLSKQIPQILGPGLTKPGKFPSLLAYNENIVVKVDEVKLAT